MSPPNVSRSAAFVALVFSAHLVTSAFAHEHHDDKIPEGSGISPDPIDSVLWTHILVQILAWGLLYPLGMVLGITRSRLHVPVQTLATCLAVLGYFLGHKHKGRQFAMPNVHATFAPWLHWALFTQVVLGAYLRLHIERGFMGTIRSWLVFAHGLLGKAMPVLAWTQMLFGGATALGFCRGEHVTQCAAHFIMGSAFIGYGILLLVVLLVGQTWLRRTGRSQEFFDSLVIAIWGCVNTFTEHRWGGAWVRNDLQHTTMGIVWWCAGLLGIWLSRTRDGRPKRNVIPGIVLCLTGYGMSAHPQELALSTMIHSFFGYTLMSAGAARVIEISFVLRDKATLSLDGSNPHSFQFMTPFLLVCSGLLFMGATEEQMALLSDAHVTHVSYILILFSVAFLIVLFANMLLHICALAAFPVPVVADPETAGAARVEGGGADAALRDGALNGHALGGGGANGWPREDRERRAVKDAQEFELDALISDDDSADEGSSSSAGRRRKERGVTGEQDEGKVRLG